MSLAAGTRPPSLRERHEIQPSIGAAGPAPACARVLGLVEPSRSSVAGPRRAAATSPRTGSASPSRRRSCRRSCRPSRGATSCPAGGRS